MPERLARAVGFHGETTSSSNPGTIISEAAVLVTVSAAPTNRVQLPKIAASKTGFHIIYNTGGAGDLVVDPDSSELMAGNTLIPPFLAGIYIAALFGAPTLTGRYWLGVVSA